MRAVLLVVVVGVLASVQAASVSDEIVRQQWKVWKAANGKKYSNPKEEKFHMKIWLNNAEKMEKHNEQYYQGEVRDLQSLNKLSDLLDSEARVQGPNDTCVASTVDGCTTGGGDGDPCIFPFTYKGVTYTKCTVHHDGSNLAWCATRVKVSGAHQYYYGFNNWDHCDDSCPGYQASARRSHQKVEPEPEPTTPEPEPEPTSTCVAWTGQDTDGGKPCVFPFEYKGTTYTSCTSDHDSSSRPWCATQVKATEEGNWYITHKWDYCAES